MTSKKVNWVCRPLLVFNRSRANVRRSANWLRTRLWECGGGNWNPRQFRRPDVPLQPRAAQISWFGGTLEHLFKVGSVTQRRRIWSKDISDLVFEKRVTPGPTCSASSVWPRALSRPRRPRSVLWTVARYLSNKLLDGPAAAAWVFDWWWSSTKSVPGSLTLDDSSRVILAIPRVRSGPPSDECPLRRFARLGEQCPTGILEVLLQILGCDLLFNVFRRQFPSLSTCCFR